jgi:hypothetical protein
MESAMTDPGVLLQSIWARTQKIKEEQALLAEDKALLESLFINEELQEWTDADDACRCVGFSVARQVRKVWQFTDQTEDLAAQLKKRQDQEKADGTAFSVSGAVSWVVRATKSEGD